MEGAVLDGRPAGHEPGGVLQQRAGRLREVRGEERGPVRGEGRNPSQRGDVRNRSLSLSDQGMSMGNQLQIRRWS